MATRGVKFMFEPGEVVLCFEPDQSKARVLYDAKILEVTTSKDRKGRRRPEYHIHFQGWNSSWDCVVPESLVLKSNAENRRLMRQLADIVKFTKKNKTRKRRIDQILKEHFHTMPRFDSDSDSSDSTEDDEDEEEDDAEITEEEEEEEEKNEEEDEELEKVNGDDKEDSESSDEDNTEEITFKENGKVELPSPNITLDIPASLKRKLEDDCYFISRKHKLVNLPSEPNIITILEGYVKHFAVNVLCSTVEKYRLRHGESHQPTKNIDLCKEVVDGLRVFFDFALPNILLYNFERSQYTKMCATYRPPPSLNKEDSDNSEVENTPRSPRLRSAGRHSPGSAEPPHKIPRLSPKQIKRESEDLSEDDLPSRRMTRNLYQEEIRRSTNTRAAVESKHSTPPYHNGKTRKRHGSGPASEVEIKVRRDSLRSSGRSVCESAPLSERVTPPPPLLIPSGISSQTPTSSCSPRHTPTYRSRCSTPTLSDNAMTAAERDGALNRVMSWKLVPDEVLAQTPPMPSIIYGMHHLLRLFVKLPDLLSEMSIPNSHLEPLLKHLEMFLEYLADRREELMTEGSYIDASDLHSKHSNRH